MANKKKEVFRPGPLTEGKRNIIRGLLQEYDIQSAADIQEALKELLGGTIKEMMEAEMDNHLGYEKSERSDSDDARNGYKTKRINTSYGSMEIDVPQDRKSIKCSPCQGQSNLTPLKIARKYSRLWVPADGG